MGNVLIPLWNDAPAATRHIIVSYPIISFVASLTGLIRFIACIPLHYALVHTYFISCFARISSDGMGFLMMLFELYLALTYFAPKEKELGSSGLLWWMMISNCLKNVVFILIAAVLSVIPPLSFYWMYPSSGFWTLIILDRAISVGQNPDGEVDVFGFKMKAKVYLGLLVLLLCLLSGMLVLDVIAAVLVGLIFKRAGFDKCLLNQHWSLKFDQLWPCCRIWKDGGNWLPFPTAQVSPIQAVPKGPLPQPSPPSGVQLFSGEGNRLGIGEAIGLDLAPDSINANRSTSHKHGYALIADEV